ncbi:MAG: YjjG family noncanonical pyrimidine nucleotidase [Chitinophagaceae bacterium]
MNSKYTHLFFDLDHTLWDFEKNSLHSLQVVYEQCELATKGINSFQEFNEIYQDINHRLWARFRNGYIKREELRWKRMWQTLIHFRILDKALAEQMSELYLDVLPTQNHLFPYAIEALAYCQSQSYEMHIITNGFEKTQIQKLKNAKLQPYFKEIITSEMAMSIKPQKEIFEYAMKKTKAEANQSIMIGDALDIDILGAKNVAMDQIFFNPNKVAHSDNPTYEIHCLSMLKDIL